MPDPTDPGGCTPPVYADDCPACADQPKGPPGYAAKFEWAGQMHRTHSQHRCPKCLRFTVWIPHDHPNPDA